MGKLLASASLVCSLMVLLGVNRGFDISDEGLYVLLADPLQENVAGIFNYDLFFKAFYHFTGLHLGMVGLRVLRLVFYLGAATSLAIFFKNVLGLSSVRWYYFLVAFLGLALGYGFLPASLSYNSLSVVGACFWLCLVSFSSVRFYRILGLGLVLGLLIYVKPTTSFLLWMITLGIWFRFGRFRWSSVLTLFIPFLLMEFVVWIVLDESALIRLYSGAEMVTNRPDYGLWKLIKLTLIGLFWTGSVFAIGFFSRSFFESRLLSFAISLVCFVFVVVETDYAAEWNHVFILLVAMIGGWVFCGKTLRPKNANFTWIVICLVLPFVLHFGSSVHWLRIGIHYMVFWIVACILGWGEDSPFPKKWISLALAGASLLIVFNGIWWHPFGQQKPLWAEKTHWKRNDSEVMQLDPELVLILGNLKELGTGRSDVPLLAAYRIPGLIWLIDGQIPFSPGIWDQSQLHNFFGSKPQKMIYNELYELPSDWEFSKSSDLGVYLGDSLVLLWE